MATTTYCLRVDIDAVLSVVGVDQTVDDDEDLSIDGTETGYITRSIEWGAQQINMRIDRIYTPAVLATSDYARDANAVLAAFYLRRRKGLQVPESLIDWRDEVINELDQIRAGNMQVPETTPSNTRQATMTNFTTRLGRTPPVLVVPDLSTGPAPGTGVKRRTL